MVRAESLSISGSVRFFDQIADSGNTVSRGFCPSCGTPIVLRSSGYPEMRFLTAGSLDEPDAFKPSQLLWHSQGRSWDCVGPGLKINAKGV